MCKILSFSMLNCNYVQLHALLDCLKVNLVKVYIILYHKNNTENIMSCEWAADRESVI